MTALKHLLITSPANLGDVHAYMICEPSAQKESIERVADLMIKETEKRGAVPLKFLLATVLPRKEWKTVEAHLRQMGADSCLKEAKNFHLTIWSSPKSDDNWIMKIHG
jgi:uncharacterized circularly permuted ATP-grasp superfamily protein